MKTGTFFHGRLQNNIQKQQNNNGREHYILAIISALTVLLLFVLFRRLTPFVYETNDDLFLRMIASGEMSGVPEAHLHFISYPAGLFLTLLYRLFPSLPWYGLLLCLPFLLTEIFVLSFLLRQIRSLCFRCAAVPLFGIVSCAFLFPHIASLQFTTSAGTAAAGALFLFLVSSPALSFQETLKNHAGFFLLTACTFCIRDQVLYMSLPFIGMIWLAKYLDARQLPAHSVPDKKNASLSLFCKNSRQKNLLKLGIFFFAMVASFVLIEKLAYHSSGWSSFRAYSTTRASIYDYEGYPDFDTHETIYRELGISRSSYEGAAHRYSLLLEPAINRHSMEVLESISSQSRHISCSQFSDKLQEMSAFFCERHLSDADKPLNLLVYRCYLLFIICALLSGKWRALRDILFILFARMVVWSYLVYHGRLPIRVSQAAYLAELAALFAIAFGYRLWLLHGHSRGEDFSAAVLTETSFIPEGTSVRTKGMDTARENSTAPYHLYPPLRQKLCYGAWTLCVLLILFTCIRSGMPNAKKTAEESRARLQFSESFIYMKNYFATHPDRFYYLDTNSFAYFTEDALTVPGQEYGNYLFMGGWAAKSPWYEKKLTAKGISDPATALYENPSVYAVFMNTGETNYDYLKEFYAENYPGVTLKVTETVDAGGGLSFLILKGYPEETP